MFKTDVPLWLYIAVKEIGVAEIAGADSNPRINEYLKTVGMSPCDEIPWCAAFVNWTFKQAFMEGTNNAMARSYLSWGIRCNPRIGAVVVFDRPGAAPGSGHVAFRLDESAGMVYVIGGNQGNRVGIGRYPANLVLGYYWPKEWPED